VTLADGTSLGIGGSCTSGCARPLTPALAKLASVLPTRNTDAAWRAPIRRPRPGPGVSFAIVSNGAEWGDRA
jgi:hypothetical protein